MKQRRNFHGSSSRSRVSDGTHAIQRRQTEQLRQCARLRQTATRTSCRTPPSLTSCMVQPPTRDRVFNAVETSPYFLKQSAERLAYAWHSGRPVWPPDNFPEGIPHLKANSPESLRKVYEKFFRIYILVSSLSGNCWRVAHFSPHRPRTPGESWPSTQKDSAGVRCAVSGERSSSTRTAIARS